MTRTARTAALSRPGTTLPALLAVSLLAAAALVGGGPARAAVAGDISTVAGNGTAGSSGDGGPGTSAELNQPDGAAPDAAGGLLIADTGNNRIREVAG
jgi:hypothetical protein